MTFIDFYEYLYLYYSDVWHGFVAYFIGKMPIFAEIPNNNFVKQP